MKFTKHKVMVENFKSLYTMVDELDNREINEAFKGQDLSSQRRDDGRFSGVENYDKMREILKDGYKDPLDKMKTAILKVGRNDNYKRPKMETDFVGFVPNVPNTLMNLPMTMVNKKRQPMKSKTIHLTYGFCVHGSIKQEQIIRGGINFVSLVNSLEKQGYRVKIDFHFASVSDKSIVAFNVNLKQYDQNLNLLKLAFPLVHPAMLRRLVFRYIETLPNLKDKGYNFGYGRPLGTYFDMDGQRERECLEGKGILKGDNSYYVTCYQAFQSKDIEELSYKIGLK